jgi:phosphohistidine phosphatase
MKTVCIIRHAKSGKRADIKDFDRPLSKRGCRNAHAIGKMMKDHNIIPSLFFTSTSIRTYTTAIIISNELNLEPTKIVLQNSLFEARPSNYYELLTQVDSIHECIAFVGHNPELSNVIMELTNGKNIETPTSSVTLIEFGSAKWNEFPVVGRLRTILYPADKIDV